MPSSPDLSHIAIVTGARGGIGRQVVQRLRTQGHRVAVVGRDAASLDSLAADARIAADTTEPQGAQAAIAACRELLGGPPTLLAHCVGSTLIAPLHRTTAAQWREVMRVNLDSAAFMLQAWVSALRESGTPGAAVFASSVVARIGVANHEAIAAAKGGVEAMVRSAAATYAAQRLRIQLDAVVYFVSAVSIQFPAPTRQRCCQVVKARVAASCKHPGFCALALVGQLYAPGIARHIAHTPEHARLRSGVD